MRKHHQKEELRAVDRCVSISLYKVTKPSDSKRQTFPKKRGLDFMFHVDSIKKNEGKA